MSKEPDEIDAKEKIWREARANELMDRAAALSERIRGMPESVSRNNLEAALAEVEEELGHLGEPPARREGA